ALSPPTRAARSKPAKTSPVLLHPILGARRPVHPRFAEVPPKPGHEAKPLARERGEKMLVRRVLRAAAVGMRDPDRPEAEEIGVDVVRQRAAEIGKDRRARPLRPLDRCGRPPHP